MKRILHSESETIEIAGKIAKSLKPGDVLALHGDLGAGKSVFARGAMRALGVRDAALPSPTFAIVQEYEGAGCRVAHMDWYRLAGAEELAAIGVRDYFRPPWICLIEWPERAPQLLPPQTRHVHLCLADESPQARKIVLETP